MLPLSSTRRKYFLLDVKKFNLVGEVAQGDGSQVPDIFDITFRNKNDERLVQFL